MKIIKKIVLAFTALIILSLTAGYFYFDKKFSPPQNYLKVYGNADNIPLKWVSEAEKISF